MPIKKFTSFESAAKALWVFNPDKEYFDTVKSNFEFWSKLSNKKIKKRIQIFSPYEEFLKIKEQFN